MPGVVQAACDQVFRECRQRLAFRAGGNQPVTVLVEDRLGLQAEIIFREGRIILPLAFGEAGDFTLVFFQQAVDVVLGMALKVDHAEQIRAHRQVHAGLAAFGQHMQPRCLELVAADLVETRMRHVEQGIDVVDQRVHAVHHPVGVHAPAFGRQPPAFLPVLELEHRMGGEAGT